MISSDTNVIEAPGSAVEMKDARLRKTGILIIDDSEGIRTSLTKVLTAEGYDVQAAADADTGIGAFDPQRVDIVLLDLQLPGKNGWDVLEQLLGHPHPVGIAIISGESISHLENFAGDFGILLEKPLNVSILLGTLEKMKRESTLQRLQRLDRLQSFLKMTRPTPRPLGGYRAY